MCVSSQAKNAASTMTPYLMISASPARELARRQRAQRARIGQHGDRLMERADHVLRARMVHGRLAADRRVDLREQRRRHLHEIDAALVARGHVTGEVADDAAAERDEAAVAMEARVDEAIDDGREGRQRLVPLAVGKDHGIDARGRAKPPARARGTAARRPRS